MLIYHKKGFIKFECPSCLNRFRVAESDFKGDICPKCNKSLDDILDKLQEPSKLIEIETCIIEEIREYPIDPKAETQKIINKKKHKSNK